MLAEIGAASAKAQQGISKHFHRLNSARRAYHVRKAFELENGKTDPAEIGKAKHYAQDVLGSKVYAPWLCALTVSHGRFREGWIPKNYFEEVVGPTVHGPYGEASNTKTLTKRLIRHDAIPDVGYFANEVFLSKEYEPIPDSDAERVFFQNGDKIVFKLDGAKRGIGVHIFERKDFSPEKIRKLGYGVFQSYLNQHEVFARITPSSVATMRMITLMDTNGHFSLRGWGLRMGRESETHVQSATQFRVPVNLETGWLFPKGYRPEWYSLKEHPNSRVVFETVRVPHYQQCIDTVLELHRLVPFVRLIGWDVTVCDDDTVKVMEWNGNKIDIFLTQMANGPCFADQGWENLWRG